MILSLLERLSQNLIIVGFVTMIYVASLLMCWMGIYANSSGVSFSKPGINDVIIKKYFRKKV